ncbi:phage tail protein, partial [Xylella fastidiosa subsp. multiplex]|nr:phage tail protein [Xylella fastidiosa subsp. multiplex]
LLTDEQKQALMMQDAAQTGVENAAAAGGAGVGALATSSPEALQGAAAGGGLNAT